MQDSVKANSLFPGDRLPMTQGGGALLRGSSSSPKRFDSIPESEDLVTVPTLFVDLAASIKKNPLPQRAPDALSNSNGRATPSPALDGLKATCAKDQSSNGMSLVEYYGALLRREQAEKKEAEARLCEERQALLQAESVQRAKDEEFVEERKQLLEEFREKEYLFRKSADALAEQLEEERLVARGEHDRLRDRLRRHVMCHKNLLKEVSLLLVEREVLKKELQRVASPHSRPCSHLAILSSGASEDPLPHRTGRAVVSEPASPRRHYASSSGSSLRQVIQSQEDCPQSPHDESVGSAVSVTDCSSADVVGEMVGPHPENWVTADRWSLYQDQKGLRRSDLLGMSIRELKATARNCGIPDDAIEYANDEDDAKEALTTLILSHKVVQFSDSGLLEESPSAAVVGSPCSSDECAGAACWRLIPSSASGSPPHSPSRMKKSFAQNPSQASSVASVVLQRIASPPEAIETPVKVKSMVQVYEKPSDEDHNAIRRSSLEQLSIRELKTIARNSGIRDDAIEYANDEDYAKEVLTTLILNHKTSNERVVEERATWFSISTPKQNEEAGRQTSAARLTCRVAALGQEASNCEPMRQAYVKHMQAYARRMQLPTTRQPAYLGRRDRR